MFLRKKAGTEEGKINFKEEPNKKQKQLIKKVKIPKTAQETIPFCELYSNGLIKVTEDYYALPIKFTNINYMLLKDEEQMHKFKLYAAVMNSLDPEIHYQEILMNKSIDDEVYKNSLLPEMDKNDGLEDIHKDYIKVQNHFISESYNKTADKKMYIALGYKIKSKNDNPLNILKKAFRDLAALFKRLDSECDILKPEETLEIFYDYFNSSQSMGESFMLPQNIYSKGRTIKDYIAPASFKFRNSFIEMGTAFTRIFYIRNYPDSLEDSFISDLMDNSYNITVTKHIAHINKGEALTFLQHKITNLESQRQDRKKKNSREGMDYIPFELQNSIDETRALFLSLQNDQDMFMVAIYISISAKTLEELNDLSKSIRTVCRKHLITLDVISHRQEQALSSVLPVSNDKINIARRMSTDAASVLMPFSVQNIFDNSGFYYGMNSKTNSLVIVDRKKLKNGNGFVLGISGAGKSFKQKREIFDVLELTEDDVIIIDPEREFLPLCRKWKGESIKVSASTNTYLNPFDINKNYGDDEDPIQTKSDFVMSMVETIKGELSPKEKTIVDRCVSKVYSDFIKNNWDEKYIPTFNEYYQELLRQPEQEAKDIALAIELYVTGSLNSFSHKSNVTLENRLTVFDTKDLGKQLKKLGLQIVLDFVWNKLSENKELGKNTWIITDEFYIFFDDRENKGSYSAECYYLIYKRSRKYGGMVTGITQNVEDLLQSPKARTMLANSQFLILLDQSPTDRAIIKDLLKLSDTQESYITNAEKGCGLMVVGKDIIPIEDEYPKDNEIYKIITTNLEEVRKYKEEQKVINEVS